MWQLRHFRDYKHIPSKNMFLLLIFWNYYFILTLWFNLHFVNTVIIIKANVPLHQAYVTLGPLILMLPNTFKLLGFTIFRFWWVPDEGYSRKASCALNYISKFLICFSIFPFHNIDLSKFLFPVIFSLIKLLIIKNTLSLYNIYVVIMKVAIQAKRADSFVF